MARKQLFFNVIFITATSFLLKISGMFFKVYLSNKLGAEKLGLYQLLMAFFGFLITLTTSGVQLSITRLLAYKYGNSECGKSANVIKVALKFVLKTTVIVSIFIFVNANIMSERIVKDSLMVLPIKILSLCLFPIAFSCCYKGYFASIRKNYLINISQIIEDLVKIFIVITIFEYFNWHKFDNMFLVLSLSIFISEIMSFIYLHFCFKIKTNCEKKHDNYKTVKKELLKSIFILGGGGLLISFIHMIENFSIPYCFRMYGFESSVSLSKYGILKGMAVPVLIFPSAIITAISNVMMPEISRLNSKNNREYMRKIIEKSIKLTIVFSVFMLGFFLCFSNEISILLYKNIEVGKIIKTLSYFVPFMYMESVLVSQLVALNREKYVFRVILS
ncbi:MAG: hypothetical protein E7391_03265, partial [Ruminococcaceae bacterium]|nr:hypothetical protein [Oscillospiraceae bacterium]